jgi:hypothetical protein
MEFIEMCIAKTGKDPYRMALFYLLGLTGETRRNIDSLYDFDENTIKSGGMFEPWQTGTSIKITRLAFNLFNGYCGEAEGEKPSLYTPYEIFPGQYLEYCLTAIRLRYEG